MRWTAIWPGMHRSPRDRNGDFEPVTVPKGTRRLTDFDDMIISLYAKGLTTRDIAEHLRQTYGASAELQASVASADRRALVPVCDYGER